MKKLINILKKKKFIPLDKFINIALYDKKSGYYMKQNPFGKNGDFITSPLVSNLFSEMIGIWCVAYWEYLKKPKKIIIAELGPGDGSLCISLIKTFKKFALFYSSIEINLLEKSSKLKRIQKLKIKNKKIKWIKAIEEINSGPVIFLANEFFDALPIKQIKKKESLFFEKYISLSKNSKLKFSYKKANKKIVQAVKDLNLNFLGNTIEYPIVAINYLKIISKKINQFGGSLLIFDYGYTKGKNKENVYLKSRD